MEAVGRLGTIISQGVSSVAAPFDPFGGAVDIIVVQQEDGTFKSTPWYVRFGKFQGVLKRRQKIVRVAVNGVEANFHMFLDHKGSAYFLEEQESDEEENIFSPPSAASSGDETSAKPVFKNEDPKNLSPSPPANDESTLFRSSEHNTPNSQISDMSTDDSASQNVKNDKSLTRTYSRKRSIFGFFRRRQRTYPDSQSSNRVGIIRSDAIQRVDSLEAAERVANLLDDRWVSGASAKTEIAVEEQDEAFEMSSFSSSNENDTSERNESEAGASLQKNVSDELGLNDLLDKNKVADNGRSILADAAYATEFERPSQGGMDHDGNPSSDGPRTDSMEPEYNDDQLNEPENGKLSQGLRTCDDKSEDRVKTNMIDEKLDKLVSGSVTNSIQMKESNGFEYNVEIKNQDIPQFGILTDSAQASREPFEEVIESQVQREGAAAYLSHDKSQNDLSAVHHSGSFLVHHNLTSEVTNYEMSYQRDQDERGVISADASEGRCQPKDLMEFAEDNFSKSEALENKMYKIFEPSLDENMHFPLERHNSSDSVQLEAKEIHNLNTDVKDTIENNKCSSLKSGLDCYQCTVLVSVDQIERDMIVAKHENVELEKMTSSMVPHDISTSIQSSNEVDNKLFCNLCKKRIGITQFETTMLQADYNHSQDHGVYETENASPIYKRSCLGHCLRDLTVVPFMEFEEGCNSRDAISGNGFVTTSNCEQDHPKLFDCDNKLKIEAISGDHVCKESVSKIFKGNIINDNGVSENMLASNGMCDSMLARKGVLGNEKEQEFIQVNNICKKHNQSNWLEIQNSDFSQQQQDTCKNPLLNGHLQDEEDFELSGNDETVLDSCLCLSEMQVQSELEIKPVSAKEEVKYKIENEIDHGSEILNTSDQSSDNPDLSAKGSRSSMRIDYLNESCMHEPVSFEMTPLYVPQLCENSKDTITQRSESLLNSGMSSLDANNAFSETVVSNSLDSNSKDTITQRSESLLNSGMSSLDANNAFSEPVVSNSLDSGAACLKKQSGHVTMATEIYNMEGKAHKECTPRESASVSMQTCTVTEAAISSMESTSAIEISLCRHLLEEGMGNGAAAEAFDSHKVSLDEFRRFSSEITKDERLVVKICGRYYPWATAAPIILGMAAFGNEEQAPEEGSIPVEQTQKPFNRSISASTASAGGRWRIWRLPFSRSRLPDRGSSSPITLDDKYVNRSESSLESTVDGSLITKNGYYMKAGKHKSRVKIPRSDQLASLNLKEGQNTITFTFSTSVLGQQQVDARVYLWKWNTKIVISDIDGTITKSDVLGQFMPLVGKDWTQLGVAHLFSAIKENGYQFMFLSARAIGQAYITRQFLVNVKQDGKCLPDGPVVMSPDGLVPSLYREVIRRTPHEFKIACLEQIRALFPSDCNPFYAGFGNRDTDEISYLKVGIPTGKIFIINPKGEVAVNRHIDPKSYTLLHTLVHGMFPAKSSFEQEDFNSWNYWRMPLPDVN